MLLEIQVYKIHFCSVSVNNFLFGISSEGYATFQDFFVFILLYDDIIKNWTYYEELKVGLCNFDWQQIVPTYIYTMYQII